MKLSKNIPNAETVKALQDTDYETVTLDQLKEDTTEYLLSSPKNKARLLESIADLKSGKGILKSFDSIDDLMADLNDEKK